LLVFLITSRLYTLPTALLASFFTLFAYFQIAWSTQARWYTLVLLLFWSAIYSLLRTLKSETKQIKLWWAIVTIIFAILVTSVHTLAILIFPTLALVYLFLKTPLLKSFLSIKVATSIFILTTIFTFIFRNELYHLINGINFSFNLPYHLSFILREYWGLLPFAIFALVTAKRTEWLLLSIYLIYLIPLSFFTSIVHYRYLFYVSPIIYILSAVGTGRLIANLNLHHKLLVPIIYFAVLLFFFISPTGTIIPQERYWLEADNPSTLGKRPGYAYTPQPDWNSAYEYVQNARTEKDLIISSHPHFTKIFLNQAGFWISFDYLGLDNRQQYKTADDREFYVGAKVIDDLAELQSITNGQTGFIIIDYMALDGRISEPILDYIENTFELVFTKSDNSYSQIFVYRF